MKRIVPLALALFALGCIVEHVGGCIPTAKQDRAIIDGSCTIIEAFSGSPEAEAICATAEELTQISSSVRNVRAEAGPGKRLATCKIVPTTTTCATDHELSTGIRAVLASRKL